MVFTISPLVHGAAIVVDGFQALAGEFYRYADIFFHDGVLKSLKAAERGKLRAEDIAASFGIPLDVRRQLHTHQLSLFRGSELVEYHSARAITIPIGSQKIAEVVHDGFGTVVGMPIQIELARRKPEDERLPVCLWSVVKTEGINNRYRCPVPCCKKNGLSSK